MAVRNFWVDADIDGRQTELGGGPRSKSGGMDVTVYQRDDGSISTAIRIACRVNFEGKLVLAVRDGDGNLLYQRITDR